MITTVLDLLLSLPALVTSTTFLSLNLTLVISVSVVVLLIPTVMPVEVLTVVIALFPLFKTYEQI